MVQCRYDPDPFVPGRITDINPGGSKPSDCDLYSRMPTNETICFKKIYIARSGKTSSLKINLAANRCYIGQDANVVALGFYSRD